MDRRAFLGRGGAGLVGAWLASGGDARAGVARAESGQQAPGQSATGESPLREIEESGRYRLLREIPRVDWIVVTPESGPVPAFALELIDLDVYPQGEVSLVIPFEGRPAEFSVLGPVPCVTTASWRRDEQRMVQHHWFDEPVAVKIYVGNGSFRDVVVVCRPAG